MTTCHALDKNKKNSDNLFFLQIFFVENLQLFAEYIMFELIFVEFIFAEACQAESSIVENIIVENHLSK